MKLKTRFLSHGTLGSKDLEATRRFYEEFLGLEVVRTSHVSLMVRLGGNHVYAVVLTKNKEPMPRCYHNGLDVHTDAEVDDAWRLCTEHAEKWGLHDIQKPSERHGTYSFLFWDGDDNAWEILSNPERRLHLDLRAGRPGRARPFRERVSAEAAGCKSQRIELRPLLRVGSTFRRGNANRLDERSARLRLVGPGTLR